MKGLMKSSNDAAWFGVWRESVRMESKTCSKSAIAWTRIEL